MADVNWGGAGKGALGGAAAGAPLGPWGVAGGAALGGLIGAFSGGGGGNPEEDAFRAEMKARAMGGGGPSAAETQFKTSADQLVAQQYALANSSPGVAPAAALRQAQVGAAGIGQGLAGQAAALRLQEQERARAMYAEMLQRKSASNAANANGWGSLLGGAGQALGAVQGGSAPRPPGT